MPGAARVWDVSRDVFNRNLEMVNLGNVTQEPPRSGHFNRFAPPPHQYESPIPTIWLTLGAGNAGA